MTRPSLSGAPGPLEEYAVRFDDLFSRLAHAALGSGRTWPRLLAPRAWNRTVHRLAGAEQVRRGAAIRRWQGSSCTSSDGNPGGGWDL